MSDSPEHRTRVEEIRHLLLLLSRTWWGKWLFLVPTVLSLLTNLGGIGALASYLAKHWGDLIQGLGERLERFIGFNPLPETLLPAIFFAPFVIGGVIEIVRGRLKRPTIISSTAGTLAYLLLMLGTVTKSLFLPHGAFDWLLLGTVVMIGVVGGALQSLPRIWVRRQRLQALSVPVLAAIAMYCFIATQAVSVRSTGTAILVAAWSSVLVSPLLAPRRLTQVAIIVLVVAFISLMNDQSLLLIRGG